MSHRSTTLFRTALHGLLCAALALSLTPSKALAAQTHTADKAETVYVSANADGSVREVSSKVVLSNNAQADTIKDDTSLSGLDSETSYARDESGLVWQAQGKEVQYKGTSDQQVPIAVHATYTLDGVVTSPAQLAGKSGHLTLRYDFENSSWEGHVIGGSVRRIYTPFVAVITLTLPHDVFRNVSVENARLNDGASSSTLLGYAMPGLRESLGLDADDLQIPEHVLVEADVSDLELGSASVIVTPELLRDLDTSELGTGELSDDMGQLQDAVRALASGSDSLTDALTQIASGVDDQLLAGIDEFRSQANALPEATGALSSGASQLASGAAGLPQAIAAAADAVGACADGLDQALSALGGLTEGARAASASLSQGIASNQEQVQGIIQSLTELSDSCEDEAQKEALTQAIAQLEALQALELTQLEAALDGIDQLAFGVSQAGGGISSSLRNDIAGDEGILGAAKAGADQLAAGAQDLSEGAQALDEKAPGLLEGLDALKQGTSTLSSALRSTADGSAKLAEGLSQLGEKGIDKLVDTVNNDLAPLSDRFEAVSEAADAYDSFSGKAEGASGSVTFVYKLDGIQP